jgi:hypothetical protein
MGKYFFLFLSLISGLIELGCILFGIHLNLSVMEVIGLGLAYQIGNLVPNPFKLNKTATSIASLLSTLCFVVSLFSELYWLLFAGFALMAAVIQSLRTSYKQKVHTALKRSSRIVGFFLSPLVNIPFALAVSVILVLGAFFSKYKNQSFEFVKPKLRYIHLIMLMQQMHYFCYCYFIVIMLFNLKFIQDLAIPPLVSVSICFALSWVTYTWIPLLLKKDTYVKYYIVTHLYLLAVLLLMGLYPESVLLAVLWILTGFGGGTGYCIEKIDLLDSTANPDDMIFIGNIGHILGVAAGMITYTIFKTPSSTIFLGAIFTVLATAMIAHYNFKYIKRTVTSESI